MTGSWWRLLAAVVLIFLATVFSRGQDVAADRSDVSPTLAILPNARLVAEVRTHESAAMPGRYPAAPGTIGLPTILSPTYFSPTKLSPAIFLRTISRTAGIIFSGRVILVERAAGGAGSYFGRDAASTTVTFQVENAVRGTAVGQSLTIHEWAGLWANGERYRVGERVLLFLYAPSRLGLTSPVAGPMGRFAVDPQGRIVIDTPKTVALAADPAIGGRSLVPYADFMRAVRSAGGEE